MSYGENDDWQSDLSSWKSLRKSQSSYQRVQDLEVDEQPQDVPRRAKTYKEMMEERQRRKSTNEVFAGEDFTDNGGDFKSTRHRAASNDDLNQNYDDDSTPRISSTEMSGWKQRSLTVDDDLVKNHRTNVDVKERTKQVTSTAKPETEKFGEPVSKDKQQNKLNSMSDFNFNKDANKSAHFSSNREKFEKGVSVDPPSKSSGEVNLRMNESNFSDRLKTWNKPQDTSQYGATNQKFMSERNGTNLQNAVQKNSSNMFCEKVIRINQQPNHEKGFGFSITGGRERNAPIVVDKVVRGGSADICELKAGDEIISINGEGITGHHNETVQKILTHSVASGTIELKVKRLRNLEEDFEEEVFSDDELKPAAARRRIAPSSESQSSMWSSPPSSPPASIADPIDDLPPPPPLPSVPPPPPNWNTFPGDFFPPPIDDGFSVVQVSRKKDDRAVKVSATEASLPDKSKEDNLRKRSQFLGVKLEESQEFKKLQEVRDDDKTKQKLRDKEKQLEQMEEKIRQETGWLQLEKERITREAEKQLSLERERLRRETEQHLQVEQQRLLKEKEEQLRKEQEQFQRQKDEKLRREHEEQLKQEKERLAKEKEEQIRLEREKIMKEKDEMLRLEKEQLQKERERNQKELEEQMRLEKEKQKQREAQLRLENDRQREREEQLRLEKERQREREEQLRLERQREQEQVRLEREKHREREEQLRLEKVKQREREENLRLERQREQEQIRLEKEKQREREEQMRLEEKQRSEDQWRKQQNFASGGRYLNGGVSASYDTQFQNVKQPPQEPSESDVAEYSKKYGGRTFARLATPGAVHARSASQGDDANYFSGSRDDVQPPYGKRDDANVSLIRSKFENKPSDQVGGVTSDKRSEPMQWRNGNQPRQEYNTDRLFQSGTNTGDHLSNQYARSSGVAHELPQSNKGLSQTPWHSRTSSVGSHLENRERMAMVEPQVREQTPAAPQFGDRTSLGPPVGERTSSLVGERTPSLGPPMGERTSSLIPEVGERTSSLRPQVEERINSYRSNVGVAPVRTWPQFAPPPVEERTSLLGTQVGNWTSSDQPTGERMKSDVPQYRDQMTMSSTSKVGEKTNQAGFTPQSNISYLLYGEEQTDEIPKRLPEPAGPLNNALPGGYNSHTLGYNSSAMPPPVSESRTPYSLDQPSNRFPRNTENIRTNTLHQFNEVPKGGSLSMDLNRYTGDMNQSRPPGQILENMRQYPSGLSDHWMVEEAERRRIAEQTGKERSWNLSQEQRQSSFQKPKDLNLGPSLERTFSRSDSYGGNLSGNAYGSRSPGRSFPEPVKQMNRINMGASPNSPPVGLIPSYPVDQVHGSVSHSRSISNPVSDPRQFQPPAGRPSAFQPPPPPFPSTSLTSPSQTTPRGAVDSLYDYNKSGSNLPSLKSLSRSYGSVYLDGTPEYSTGSLSYRVPGQIQESSLKPSHGYPSSGNRQNFPVQTSQPYKIYQESGYHSGRDLESFPSYCHPIVNNLQCNLCRKPLSQAYGGVTMKDGDLTLRCQSCFGRTK